MHYTGQLLKQFYVLVFGLDVIGNPFGLVVGLTKGVEDFFYEPFQVRSFLEFLFVCEIANDFRRLTGDSQIGELLLLRGSLVL